MKNKKSKNIWDWGRKIVYFVRTSKKRKPKFDKDHTLCMRCYTAHRNKLRGKDSKRSKKWKLTKYLDMNQRLTI